METFETEWIMKINCVNQLIIWNDVLKFKFKDMGNFGIAIRSFMIDKLSNSICENKNIRNKSDVKEVTWHSEKNSKQT